MRFRVAIAVAAASGFVALSYEILWYRLFAFVTQGAPIAFGALLGAYLVGIAVGSYGSRLYCEASGVTRAGRALGRFLFLANVVSFLVAPATGWLVTIGPWSLGLVVVLVATTLLGAVLPLTSHLAIAPDDRAGARLSYLYLANILGSCLGSLVTGFVAMDHLSTRELAVGLAWLGFILAGAVTVAADEGRGARALSLAAAAGLAVVTASVSHLGFDQLYERLLYRKGFEPGIHFAETVENRSGIINVTREGKVFGGGAYDGAFNTSLVNDHNVIERAYAVSVLHPGPRRMLMIGLSTGSWAKVLAAAPGVERFTIVEINPGYLGLIAHHDEVAGILTDPRVGIVVDDGRRWLEAHPNESFDAIVMNMTWHWRAHATNLLSREFFDLVKRHLHPGGLFFFNTTFSKDACKTALASFPYTFRVSNFVAASDAPLTFDRDAWEGLLSGYRIDGRLVLRMTQAGAHQAFARLLAFADPAGGNVEDDAHLRESCAAGEVITDDNMLSEWRELSHWEPP
jgi:predicted membrane-bound spermidine synthase